jgi:hypothetical protein
VAGSLAAALEALEADAVVTDPRTAASDEAAALRRELLLRILLQNALLILSLALFTAFAILTLLRPGLAWAAAAGHGAAGLGAALQWCHHGIRTRQIKAYLLMIEADAGDGTHPQGWERWLPAHRPQTLLGSRWLISTKGSFIGLQLAMIVLALRVAPAIDPIPALAALGLALAAAGFLLTNPKE